MSGSSPSFTGSIPEIYDRCLRPVLFEPYAIDLATRVAIVPGMTVLELACGTGILTRALLGVLPGDATLVATDVSEQMLAMAQQQVSPDERLAWQPADAMTLPFDPASFDVVACQFGIMFFADKPRALAESRRVLRTGGILLFNTWDAMARNEIALVAHQALLRAYPAHPPRFFEIPFGFCDAAAITALVTQAGFSSVRVETVALEGHSPSAHDAATGLVNGTPVAVHLKETGGPAEPGIAAVEAALVSRFGDGPLSVSLSALIIEAR